MMLDNDDEGDDKFDENNIGQNETYYALVFTALLTSLYQKKQAKNKSHIAIKQQKHRN